MARQSLNTEWQIPRNFGIVACPRATSARSPSRTPAHISLVGHHISPKARETIDKALPAAPTARSFDHVWGRDRPLEVRGVGTLGVAANRGARPRRFLGDDGTLYIRSVERVLRGDDLHRRHEHSRPTTACPCVVASGAKRELSLLEHQ
jgi:hypothetical protein